MGNVWAGVFAKLGAQDAAVADFAVAALQATIKNCQLPRKFLARAVKMISANVEQGGRRDAQG
eukprot:3447271-Pyramimonas_sp.AAC.1